MNMQIFWFCLRAMWPNRSKANTRKCTKAHHVLGLRFSESNYIYTRANKLIGLFNKLSSCQIFTSFRHHSCVNRKGSCPLGPTSTRRSVDVFSKLGWSSKRFYADRCRFSSRRGVRTAYIVVALKVVAAGHETGSHLQAAEYLANNYINDIMYWIANWQLHTYIKIENVYYLKGFKWQFCYSAGEHF